jgi:poly-gamma-glutamate synthesis protein (capsule biosynthesis protein)
MTGRGIDQILAHPGDPRLFEPHVRDARTYVELAEARSGAIAHPAAFAYVWGEALEELRRMAPGVRIVNLETAVTASGEHWQGKEVHYRMHPANVPCLGAAGIDCCVLANNHVMDWGVPGLEETLAALRGAGIATAGAGRLLEEAAAPAVLPVGETGRVVLFAVGTTSSGIPGAWAATETRPGVHLLEVLDRGAARRLGERVRAVKRDGDLVVVSVHWGGNWGYEVPRGQREFARALIDEAAVDVVHGHSSHHAKAIEVYRGRPILYGCGDLLNDYEGIEGYEEFRDDLALLYFPTIDPAGRGLVRLELVPLRIQRFRLHRASGADAEWLRATLSREGAAFGTWLQRGPAGTLALRWG